MDNMKVEISNGELLDKISILELKMLRIEDEVKLVNIQKEFYALNPLVVNLFENNDSDLQNHYTELANINSQLWKIEDEIRECEKNQDFGPKFIKLARDVYITNDKRCEVKKIINILTNSGFVEEKSYKEY
jgi:predicted  nucleic acid-binding Zn-ribbon protein